MNHRDRQHADGGHYLEMLTPAIALHVEAITSNACGETSGELKSVRPLGVQLRRWRHDVGKR